MKENNQEDIKKERQKNFRERLWFVKYWADYIKTHPDDEWSKQQKVLIDSQIENARSFGKKKVCSKR